MADKVTVMVLKVDLQCSCCYKKVKKLLCKFPEIRDQVYDEKQNTVTITVVCCSPEKVRDKLCCKGGKVIKSIDIIKPPKEPEKPKLPPPEKPKPTPAEKPKAPEKPKELEKPKAPEKPKELEKPKASEKPKEPGKPKAPEKPKEPGKPIPNANKPPGNQPTQKPPNKPVQVPVPVPVPKAPEPAPGPPQPAPMIPIVTGHGYPSIFPYEACCGPCSEGRDGGPCHQGYGRPGPACYDNSNYGYGSYDRRRPCYVSPCDYYEESTSACTIM